jgi:hypothetical protein
MNAQPRDTDYSGTPLLKKLGLVSAKGDVGEVALLGEPDGFRVLLGEIPTGISIHTKLRESTKLALCFVRSRAELAALLDMLATQLPPLAHLWFIHPKAHTPRSTSDWWTIKYARWTTIGRGSSLPGEDSLRARVIG